MGAGGKRWGDACHDALPPSQRPIWPDESSMQYWIFLTLAIISEVIATSALRATDGFTRLVPSLIVVVGYGCSFYFLALTLRVIPVGVAYAIWCGAGMALIALIGWLVLGQKLDVPALVGIGFITVGVGIIYRFSGTVAH